MGNQALTVQGTGTASEATSRSIYIILGICFGLFGIHNFYAQRWRTGLVQLSLTIVGMILSMVVVGLFLLSAVYLWSLSELLVVSKDGEGLPMT